MHGGPQSETHGRRRGDGQGPPSCVSPEVNEGSRSGGKARPLVDTLGLLNPSAAFEAYASEMEGRSARVADLARRCAEDRLVLDFMKDHRHIDLEGTFEAAY